VGSGNVNDGRDGDCANDGMVSITHGDSACNLVHLNKIKYHL
jgi:hypothetical protein